MEYKKALAFIKSNSILEQEEGTEVIFKQAQETVRGNLDPFLLKDLKQHLGGTNDAIKEAPQEIQMPDFSNLEIATAAALQMRATMGSPNIDLSNGVTTEYRLLKGTMAIFRYEFIVTKKRPNQFPHSFFIMVVALLVERRLLWRTFVKVLRKSYRQLLLMWTII